MPSQAVITSRKRPQQKCIIERLYESVINSNHGSTLPRKGKIFQLVQNIFMIFIKIFSVGSLAGMVCSLCEILERKVTQNVIKAGFTLRSNPS